MSKYYKGKAACCIEMLYYLNTGRKYSVSELAEKIGTKPRNIIEYKKELDEVASSLNWPFSIEHVVGRYGGYRLKGNAVLPSFALTESQKNALIEAFDYIMSKKDFMNKVTFERAFANVMASVEVREKPNDLMVVDKYQLTMPEEEIRKRYLVIKEAVEQKKQIEMEYTSLTSGTKTVVCDPYKLFIYNNSWFFIAWNKEAGNPLYYKVNRIQSVHFTGKKFAVWKQFRPEKYFDGQGLAMNGNIFHCEFIARGVRAALFKERVYGTNQTIEQIDENTIKVSLDMQNEGAIVSFALSCGLDLDILSPDWLKERVRDVAKELAARYDTEAK